MKRKTAVMTTALLLTLGAATVLTGQDAQAAKKKKVKASVKGSTLTISGKGAMPSSLKVKKSKQKKIKKIVVKKGVTSIPVKAFTKFKNVTSTTVASSVKKIGQDAFKCKKLKKLTVPGNFTIVSRKNSKGAPWITDKINTVTFNTKLDLERAAAFDTNNLVVKKSDPNYKSIKGIIYSKDGKEIVRVPFQRSEVVLEDGCETFCLQSVLYANADIDSNSYGGCRVKKIVIPASVKKVESDRHFALSDGGLIKRMVDRRVAGLQTDVKTKLLDDASLSQLIHVLGMSSDSLMKQLPDQISQTEGLYVSDEHTLLDYRRTDHLIKIPKGIKKIGDYAFYRYERISELSLPEGLTEIGEAAFHTSSVWSFYEDYSCLNVLVLPDSLVKIGDDAFANNEIREIKFGKNVKVIGDYAFDSNLLSKLTIPSSVEKIGSWAFARQSGVDDTDDIVIQGSSAGFADMVFGGGRLIYEKGPQEQKVSLSEPDIRSLSTKKIKVLVSWTQIKNADGYELVTATNAKFTKNKKQTILEGEQDKKELTLTGKFKKTTKVYAKMRPFTYMDGKKVYGRWSQSVS